MKTLVSKSSVNRRNLGRGVVVRFPGAVALALVLALSLALAGCSFFSPDFSAEETPAPTTVSLTAEAGGAQVRNGAGEAPATAQSAAAPGAGQPAGSTASSVEGAEAAEAEETGAATPRDIASQAGESLGPGPLSNILGDNVSRVSPPGSSASGDSTPGGSEQLSDLTPQAIVEAQELVLKGIYDNVLPSVVLIKVARNLGSGESRPEIPDIPGIPRDFFERTGGTGFVWDDQGHIITNHHVVAEADRVTVVLPNRTEMDAEFLGSDPDSDLAVLRVSDPDGMLSPVTLGDSDQVYMGQIAVAMGNPFGQQFSITTGIISGIGRTIRSGHSPFSIPEVLQTDAPINPGNSGGPLLDRYGHVIGVNTQIVSRTGVNSGIGFAVPINIAKQVVPAILEDGKFQYSWLGISGASLAPDIAEAMDLPRNTRGALVIEIVPDGPAEQAGLQGSDEALMLEGLELPVGGDIIVSINGEPVSTIDDVITFLVGKTRPDQEVTMEVIRDGDTEQLTVTLGTRPGS